MSDPSPRQPTGCIHVCVLGADGLCQGCHRTAAEIARWPGALSQGSVFGGLSAPSDPGHSGQSR